MNAIHDGSDGVLVALGLGSNLGNSQQILTDALATLAQTDAIFLESVSHFYQTDPIGPPQPDYLNACAILRVTLTPHRLLQHLLQIEQQFGRVRRERWGPRLLDLDLLLFGDQIIDTPTLQIPHPRMNERAFVLVPLAEIAPHWIDPITGKTIVSLMQTVDCSGIRNSEFGIRKEI
jgi:2-amino-4-hydroxy-6-hydroxymethyldihydropteridine diphosphokinase